MKIFTSRITKIVRIILWSLVGLLLAFIMFMTGGAVALYQIEKECEIVHAFQTQEGKNFFCAEIKLTPKKDGELS